MLAAFSFNRDKFQPKAFAWLIAAHHRVGSNGAFLYQKMQIGHLAFRKGPFDFEKHPLAQTLRTHDTSVPETLCQ